MYTVYKTTNTVNGKFYIGVHKTNYPEDSYLGSGRLIRTAIKKYGKGSFRKEILFITEYQNEAYAKERELLAGCYGQSDCYNMIGGGPEAFFEYLNSNGKAVTLNDQRERDPDFKRLTAEASRKAIKELWATESLWTERVRKIRSKVRRKQLEEMPSSFVELNKSAEFHSKRKAAFARIGHQQGEKNSAFGTIWITNGEISKKQHKDEPIPEGWKPGRVIKRDRS